MTGPIISIIILLGCLLLSATVLWIAQVQSPILKWLDRALNWPKPITMTVLDASSFKKGDIVHISVSGTNIERPMRIVGISKKAGAHELKLEEVR